MLWPRHRPWPDPWRGDSGDRAAGLAPERRREERSAGSRALELDSQTQILWRASVLMRDLAGTIQSKRLDRPAHALDVLIEHVLHGIGVDIGVWGTPGHPSAHKNRSLVWSRDYFRIVEVKLQRNRLPHRPPTARRRAPPPRRRVRPRAARRKLVDDHLADPQAIPFDLLEEKLAACRGPVPEPVGHQHADRHQRDGE